MPEAKKEQVLSVRDLDITFKTTAGPVHAIRGVNIDLYKGETVALVGESGSGKSVTMKAAMGILAKNATVNSGSIRFSYHHADGSPETVDLLQKDKKWIRRHINGKRIAMVFQDPMTSLDPPCPSASRSWRACCGTTRCPRMLPTKRLCSCWKRWASPMPKSA